MAVDVNQDFACPHCGGINSFKTDDCSALKEEIVRCSHCNVVLSVTLAAGLGDSINLIVSENEEEAAIR